MKINKESIVEYVKGFPPFWVKALPVIFVFGLGWIAIYQYGQNQYQRGRIDAEAMYLKTSSELSDRIRGVEGTVLTQFREGRKGIRDLFHDSNAELRALIVDKECVSDDFKNEYNKRLKK